ncbi:tetratricopeptide repeat protein, partial [candidate division GN15 bacterium]|nr:tetratricopeptide repeat protein [candidate division GN15 bacterium]
LHSSGAMIGVANALRLQGRAEEAEPMVRAALEIRVAELPPEHWQIAQARAILGLCLADMSQDTDAASLLESSLGPLRERLGPDHWLPVEAGARLKEILNGNGQSARTDSLQRTMTVRTGRIGDYTEGD